mmetsp:Transcript_65457/g.122500  ORF Transcript_65457/g.122500 Transcript_65457/m.122500 type:complete len:322 (+) Transcript_65457:185-1150(+)
MKFGKEYMNKYAAIDSTSRIPPFPYKQLKKLIDDGGGESAAVFFSKLREQTSIVDRAWKREAERTIFAARRLPRRASEVYLGGQSVEEKSLVLAAWASLSREALRKILKKHSKKQLQYWEKQQLREHQQQKNEHQQARQPQISQMPQTPTRQHVSFARGCLRTQIEALASSSLAFSPTAPSLSPLSAASYFDADSAAHNLTCPVCLDVVIDPVAPIECGHPVCGPCFKALKQNSAAGQKQCPVCRGPVGVAKALPLLGRAAKRMDPVGVHARELELAEERERQQIERDREQTERRIARHLARHPMSALIHHPPPPATTQYS